MMTTEQMTAAETALIALDPKLGAVVARQRPLVARTRGGYFE